MDGAWDYLRFLEIPDDNNIEKGWRMEGMERKENREQFRVRIIYRALLQDPLAPS
jgi:hypothetical protein